MKRPVMSRFNAGRPKKQGVVGLLQNHRGQFLFIRRALSLERAPGWWCFPGGEVNDGEALDAALRREWKEELALDIQTHSTIHVTISPGGIYRLHWMRVSLQDPKQVPEPNQDEVAEVRHISLAAAKHLTPVLPTLRIWLHRKTWKARERASLPQWIPPAQMPQILRPFVD